MLTKQHHGVGIGLAVVALAVHWATAAPLRQPMLPEHVTPQMRRAVQEGLSFLADRQSPNGSWQSLDDGSTYPVAMTSLAGMALLAGGNTPSRGPYADQVRAALRYVTAQSRPSGLIAGPGGESGQPMYGHGFGLLFLASAYGMETDEAARRQMAEVIEKGINLTARAQSAAGGWTYTPGAGDEGSVTVTQMQALRAAHNAGFTVPEQTVRNAVRYLERCQTPDGGIRYSLRSGPQTRLPISAAAVACLYSAGDYDSPLANDCLSYVFGRLKAGRNTFNRTGHTYYLHLYAAQAFYQAGDNYWTDYFPNAGEFFLDEQRDDGSWEGDGVGKVYGTSVALIVLQLPYKFLPIYQR